LETSQTAGGSAINLSATGASYQATQVSSDMLMSEVSQLLQSVGLGDDPVLRALIALLVLAALMQQQQTSSATALLDLLAQGRAGADSYSFSSTSISFESTYTETVSIQSAYEQAGTPQPQTPSHDASA
jgi:hypothetical protein